MSTRWWRDTSGMERLDELLYPLVIEACMERGMRFELTGDEEEDAAARDNFWNLYCSAPSSFECTETELLSALSRSDAQRPEWIKNFVAEIADYIVSCNE